MDLADVFRYMATFIKISNHLALILPGMLPVLRRFGVLLNLLAAEKDSKDQV